jgi:hypothetical protein
MIRRQDIISVRLSVCSGFRQSDVRVRRDCVFGSCLESMSRYITCLFWLRSIWERLRQAGGISPNAAESGTGSVCLSCGPVPDGLV